MASANFEKQIKIIQPLFKKSEYFSFIYFANSSAYHLIKNIIYNKNAQLSDFKKLHLNVILHTKI